MDLFVIRHAAAEEASPGQDDSTRELTRDGIKRFRQVVQGLRELGLAFDRIVTSPWARAIETAALLAPLCDDEPVQSELLCQPPRAELLALIAETTSAHPTGTALVGHEPWTAELVAWLAFGDTRHGRALELKKGGVVWLDGGAVPGGMTVRAILPPKIVRELR